MSRKTWQTVFPNYWRQYLDFCETLKNLQSLQFVKASLLPGYTHATYSARRRFLEQSGTRTIPDTLVVRYTNPKVVITFTLVTDGAFGYFRKTYPSQIVTSTLYFDMGVENRPVWEKRVLTREQNKEDFFSLPWIKNFRFIGPPPEKKIRAIHAFYHEQFDQFEEVLFT